MANEAEKALLADVMEAARASMASIAQAQKEHAKLTATAFAAHKRVRVVVNANGVVIETRFGTGAEDMTHEEIARAFTAAAQDAAAQMQRKTKEMIEGLQQDQARLPRLSEFFPEVPDAQDMLPTPPEVSTAPPGSHARAAVSDEPVDGAMEFSDVVEWDHDRPSRKQPRIADSGW